MSPRASTIHPEVGFSMVTRRVLSFPYVRYFVSPLTQVIEEHLWRLAILVRDQSRGPPIALNRRDFLRRIVDLRMYEILLLHVRTQIIWDGVDHSGHTGCTTLDTLTLPLSSALLHEIVE